MHCSEASSSKQPRSAQQPVKFAPARQPSAVHSRARRRRPVAAKAAAKLQIPKGQIAEVEELEGVRVIKAETGKPLVQYLVNWKARTL